MKTYLPIAIVAFGLSSLNAQIVTGFSEDFNTGPAAAALGDFKQFGGGAAAGYSWDEFDGTGGTGGVTLTGGAIPNFYRTGSGMTQSNFDINAMAAGDIYTTSVDLRIGTSLETLTVLNFGFTTQNADTPFTGSTSLTGGIIRNGTANFVLRMRSGSTSAAELTFNQSTLTNNDWYRVTLELTKSATANEFGYGLTLYSIGANGISAPTVFNDGTKDITLAGTVSNTLVYNTSTAQWVIDARPTTANGGIYTLDNFSTELTAVPEPTSVALLIGGGLMLMVAGARGRFRRNRI